MIKGINTIIAVIVVIGLIVFLGYDVYEVNQNRAAFIEGYHPDSLFTLYEGDNINFKTINGVNVNSILSGNEIQLPSDRFYSIYVDYKDDGLLTETTSNMMYDTLVFFSGEKATFYGTESTSGNSVFFDILFGDPETSKVKYDSLVTAGAFVD